MPKVRLDSWKSIAEYLERSTRTVQRWHVDHALPVHRFGGSKGSVFAYEEEIEGWLTGIAQRSGMGAANGDDSLSGRQAQSREMTLRARELWDSRSEQNMHAIAGLYRRAIENDPANVEALAGFASTMIWASLDGTIDGAIAYPAAEEALRRARQADADSAEARCAAAWLRLIREREPSQARSDFEEVLCGHPGGSFALTGLALCHVAEGDLDGARVWAWKAWRNSTLVPMAGAVVCWIEYLAGAGTYAIELANQMRLGGCGGELLSVAEALAHIAAGPEASRLRRIAALAGDRPQSLMLQCAMAYECALEGKPARAREVEAMAELASPERKRGNAYGMAMLAAALGNDMEAARWIGVACAEGSLWSLGIKVDPLLKALRESPLFPARLHGMESEARPGARGSHLELVAQASGWN